MPAPADTLMRDAAVELVRWRCEVFPLNGKVPVTSHGFHDAKCDDAPLLEWWPDGTRRGIGVRTGTLNRDGRVLFVVDIDPRDRGDYAWHELVAGREVPDTAEVATGRGDGGRHLWFWAPFGWNAWPKSVRPGVDIKGPGGYVVAPPSLHPDTGDAYRWERTPPEAGVANAPVWLLEALEKACASRPAAQGGAPIADGFLTGERNNMLASLAGSMRRRGMVAQEILPALLAVNAGRCRPPLPEREVSSIAASAERNMDAADPIAPTGEGGAEGGPTPWTLSRVVDEWALEGPLVHLETGLESLDRFTRGGLVYGRRCGIIGAPNAAKTALLGTLAMRWAQKGILVGMLLVDEEPIDFAVRVGMMLGFSRAHCEDRDPDVLKVIREKFEPLEHRIPMYGYDYTIESAVADIAERAGGAKFVFMMDSIQTVWSIAGRKSKSDRERIDCNVEAIRKCTARYRCLTMFTSEMPRAGYGNEKSAAEFNDMSAGKHSGSIEYLAQTQLVLKTVKGDGDRVLVNVPKNKLGESNVSLFFAMDRSKHEIAEVSAPVEGLSSEAVAASVARDNVDVRIAYQIVLREPGIGVKALKARLGSFKWGKDRVARIVDLLLDSDLVDDRAELHGKITYHHLYGVRSPLDDTGGAEGG